MIYKRKLTLLSSLVAILALVYILTLVFDPERQHSKAFAWLEQNMLSLADAIEISSPEGNTVLKRRNNVWVFDAGTVEYPVKQGRVEDLLTALSKRDVYPLRASSGEAREKLGLSTEAASRILVRGGAGLPLLDLLIGSGGALGRELYLARAGEKEIYSGEDRFTLYTDSGAKAWYDLRLFPSIIEAAMVQQADVSFSAVDVPPVSYALRRSGGGWVIIGEEGSPLGTPTERAKASEGSPLDNSRVDSWLRVVLEAQGEDFDAGPPVSSNEGITLRLGDGTVRTIQIGPADEDKRRRASVSGSKLVYVLAESTINRLFRESDYFKR